MDEGLHMRKGDQTATTANCEPRRSEVGQIADSGSHARLARDGGSPVRVEAWPTYEIGDAYINTADEDAGIAAIRARRYFRYDARALPATDVGRFEAQLCRYFDAPHALACTSGTTALSLALLALGLTPTTRVLCPAFTFAATPSAIRLAGLTPEFVDCDDELHLDLLDLRRKLTPEVGAVVVVHMRGFAADVDAVRRLTDPLGIPVIEDAVPGLGARLRGRLLGTLGVASAFSTQSDKSINTGEGGFLITSCSELFARAVVYSGAYESRMARHFGAEQPPESVSDQDYPIFGWRMDEIRGAMARSMLTRLDQRVALHRRNYQEVTVALDGIARIALRRPVAEDAVLGESLLFRVLDPSPMAAAAFADALRAEGIAARNIGAAQERNARAFWNWRFCFGDAAQAKRMLPRTAATLQRTVDISLSANLTPRDRSDLVAAVRKVATRLPVQK